MVSSAEPAADPYGAPETRERILSATLELVSEGGSGLKLSDVAARAGVSRQAIYLHFGDRSGLFVGLVQHMDEVLDLETKIQHIFEAPTSRQMLERALRLNTVFWEEVAPVAEVLIAAQHEDDALAAAWRDRLELRRMVFAMIVRHIAEAGDLEPSWDTERAGEVLYGIACFETWRELTHHLGWDHETYVAQMSALVTRALLA